jgi:putative membrane protein
VKKGTLNQWIWFIILAGFSLYLGRLLFTGDIHYFIHPKMFFFIRFSFVIFLLLCVNQGRRILFSKRKEALKAGYILFILPLLLGFAVAPKGLNEAAAANRGLQLAGSDSSTMESSRQLKASEIIEQLGPEETLEVETALYSGIIEDISKRRSLYMGRRIGIEGFVFRFDHFSPDQFIVARMQIVCCAADALLTGILVQSNEAPSFETSSWVRVEGIIGEREYYDAWNDKTSVVPAVKAELMHPVEKPLNVYVYPSE